jgi:NADPH:quinone reductase-like Zn-dependent oxidoreductase
MLAVFAEQISDSDPLSGLRVGEQREPANRDGWTTVRVKASSLNHHDIWSLRGVGLSADRLPMILGCDAAGLDEQGNEVIVHAVIATPDWRGDETLDPGRALLSEGYPGTFADKVAAPTRNLLPKPPELSFEEAACLPTAWLTAYRMLFKRAQTPQGSTILVQGAGGGVATALIQLGAAAGVRVWVTSRSSWKREQALELGAEQAFVTGARLPERVDAVMETVGGATWRHSIRSVRDGGTVVVAGATTRDATGAELSHIFFRQLSVLGSTMGTRDELAQLLRFCVQTGVRPLIHETLPLMDARAGFSAMASGDIMGKIVFTHDRGSSATR